MKRGKYIIIEGGEGCGKDLQADLLASWLKSKNLEVVLTREPGGTKESDKIRKILLDKNNQLSPVTELFLYEAARRDLNDKIVKPSLEQGKFILCNRGFPSTHAYQGFAGKIDLEIVERENKLAMNGSSPDLIFIIDGDSDELYKKITDPDRFAKKGLEYHKKVREGYLDFAKKYNDISIVISYMKDNPGKMQDEIRNHLVSKLKLL